MWQSVIAALTPLLHKHCYQENSAGLICLIFLLCSLCWSSVNTSTVSVTWSFPGIPESSPVRAASNMSSAEFWVAGIFMAFYEYKEFCLARAWAHMTQSVCVFVCVWTSSWGHMKVLSVALPTPTWFVLQHHRVARHLPEEASLQLNGACREVPTELKCSFCLFHPPFLALCSRKKAKNIFLPLQIFIP